MKIEIESFHYLDFKPPLKRVARPTLLAPRWKTPVMDKKRPLRLGAEFPNRCSAPMGAESRYPL